MVKKRVAMFVIVVSKPLFLLIEFNVRFCELLQNEMRLRQLSTKGKQLGSFHLNYHNCGRFNSEIQTLENISRL